MRRVLIPNPSQGPIYDLTDDWLYVRAEGNWRRTPTRNDGRWMVAHPAIPERLYRGDHPNCAATDAADIPFERSDDGGTTWRVLHAGRNVRPLMVDPALGETIYGSDCRLAISHDAGVTWSRYDPLPGFRVIAVAVDGARLYVLGVSADDEGRIRAINLSDPLAPVEGDIVLSAIGLRCIDAREGRVVAGGVFGTYVSDDGGLTWSISRTGLEAVTRSDVHAQRLATAVTPWGEIGVLTIKIGLMNKHRIFAGTSNGMYLSQDDGATWVAYTVAPVDQPILEIQFALGGADLFVTTPRGVSVAPSP